MNPAIRTLAFAALSVLAAPASAEWLVYSGRIAGQPVAAILDIEAGRVQRGEFAYLRHGRPMELVVRDSASVKECDHPQSRDRECAEPTGIWEIERVGDEVRGRWKKRDGDRASQEIVLERARKTFTELLLEANQIEIEEGGDTGIVAWQMMRERRTGVVMPRLTKAPEAEAMQRINAVLRQMLNDAVAMSFDMLYYENRQAVKFANPRLFAIAGSVDYDGGGAHPSSGFTAATFDLVTGEQVHWERRLRIATNAPQLDLSREDLLASAVVRAMQRSGEGCLQTALAAYGCDQRQCTNAAADELFLQFYPTHEGLAVASGAYTEAERGCRGETAIVPWREVRSAAIDPARPLP
jgi:hypothetical protein